LRFGYTDSRELNVIGATHYHYRFASGRNGADSSWQAFVPGGGGTGMGNPRNAITKKTGNNK